MYNHKCNVLHVHYVAQIIQTELNVFKEFSQQFLQIATQSEPGMCMCIYVCVCVCARLLW